MATYIVRRLLISIPVFFGITIIVFTFTALAPGNLADALIRPEMANDPAARQAIMERYGLDQPLHIRYVRWLVNAAQGELGYRPKDGQPVAAGSRARLHGLARAHGTALIIGLLVGVPLGVLSAVRQYSKLDFLLTGITFLGISLPSFLLAIGGLWLLGLQLRIVPDRRHDDGRQASPTSSTSCATSRCRSRSSASATWRSSCATRARRCSTSPTRSS